MDFSKNGLMASRVEKKISVDSKRSVDTLSALLVTFLNSIGLFWSFLTPGVLLIIGEDLQTKTSLATHTLRLQYKIAQTQCVGGAKYVMV